MAMLAYVINGVSWGGMIVFLVQDEIQPKLPLVLVMSGFCLPALGFLAKTVLLAWQAHIWGASEFALKRVPVAVGEQLEGVLTVGKKHDWHEVQPMPEILVTLHCLAERTYRQTIGRRELGGTVAYDEPLWQQTRIASPSRDDLSNGRCRLPVMFQIPDTCPGTRDNDPYIKWNLEVQIGRNLSQRQLTFQLPVFRVTRASAPVATNRHPENGLFEWSFEAMVAYADGELNENTQGFKLVFDVMRPSRALLQQALMLAPWPLFCLGTMMLGEQTLTYGFIVLSSIVGIAVLAEWLTSIEVSAHARELRWIRRVIGIGRRHRLNVDEIDTFIAKQARGGVGTLMTECVFVVTKEGKERLLVDRLPSRVVGKAIADRLCKTMQKALAKHSRQQ